MLGGLILVAYQISQTNEALRQEALGIQLTSYGAGNQLLGEFQLRIAENPELSKIWESGLAGKLSEDQQFRFGLLADNYFNAQITLYGFWNAVGEGRGDTFVKFLVDDLRNNAGLCAEYIEFRERVDRRMEGQHNVDLSDGGVQLNRGYWGKVDDAIEGSECQGLRDDA